MSPYSSREYIPLISSPLNPAQPYTPPARVPSTPGRRRSSQMRGDLSPTERLLRQKAALAWKSTQGDDDDNAGSQSEKPRARVEYGRAAAARGPARKHAAHWEDDNNNDEVGAFYSDAGEYDYDDDDEARAWSRSVLAMRPRFLRDTARRALLMFGITCIGGCLPVFAFLSSAGSPGGVWSLGGSGTQAATA